MADDHTQRSFRAADGPARPASGRAGSSGNDPLAELARLIGQNDPFGEFGRARAGDTRAAQPEQPSRDHYATPPASGGEPFGTYAQPAYDAPPMAVADQPGYATQGYDPAAHPEMHPDVDPNAPPFAAEEVDFYDDVPPRRRVGVLAVAAVFGLAVLGTAGAFGYRALFGSSGSGPPPIIKAEATPSKVIPADKKDAQSGKLIQDRVTDRGMGEKLVSREEQPIDMDKPVGVFPQVQNTAASSGSVQPPMLGSGVVAGDPKKVQTIAIRPDGMTPAPASAVPTPVPPADAPAPRVTNITPARPNAEPDARPERVASAGADAVPTTQSSSPPPAAAPSPPPVRNAPLSLSPNAQQAPAPQQAPAAPAPPRSVSAPTRLAPEPASSPSVAATGGYAVQISSRRSEEDAQAAFRSLQSRFPDQLGGRQPLIRRVDLGEKGIYFRTMVGPFGSPDDAKQLCEELKAAGGSCFIQRI